jgi:hypothetical protein
MTELDLYKFITDNALEYNAVPNIFHHVIYDEIWLFVPNYLLTDFSKLLGHNITDDDYITAVFKGEYCCFDMIIICEYFGINYNSIFKK